MYTLTDIYTMEIIQAINATVNMWQTEQNFDEIILPDTITLTDKECTYIYEQALTLFNAGG